MRTVTVRCDVVTIRTVLHSLVSVSPSITATVVTQWLEALWHKESEEEVCNKNWSCTSQLPFCFFSTSVDQISSSARLTFSVPSKRGMSLWYVRLPF